MSPRRNNVMLLSRENKKIRYDLAVGRVRKVNGLNAVKLYRHNKL